MTTTADSDTVVRGHLFRKFGEGFHQCWYPVALSESLEKGQSFGTEFCDGRIVVYRGDDGIVRGLTPYCPHMGADLSVGDVVGNDIRCPFHHWQFGGDGRCTQIPSGDRISKAARVSAFPVEERYGIVWVFLGEEPLYPLPSIPLPDGMRVASRAFEVPFPEPLRVEPWVFATNLFDFVHFRVVHKVEGLDPEVEVDGRRMKWTATMPHPTVGEVTSTAELWGTNSAMTYGSRGAEFIGHIAASTFMGEEQGTRFFVVVVAELTGDDAAAHARAEQALDAQQALHTQLMVEDLPIMNSLRLGQDHLVASDRKLAAYLRYAREYPRATMASLGG